MKKPEKKKDRENYVEPPKDFEVPELEENETFEVVMEVTKKKEGLCITAWDGIEVPKDGEEDEASEEETETIGAGARRMMKGGY